MVASLPRPYKEREPVETIAAIRRILAPLGLSPEPYGSANPYPELHSVGLCLPPSQGSFAANGKGRSAEYCMASGHAEFIERLQNGLFARFPRTIAASFRDRYGFYYAPDERYLSEEQLLALPGDVLDDLVRYGGAGRETFVRRYAARARANGAPGIVAVPFYDTGQGDVVCLPFNLLLQATGSNGMAAGNTLPEALYQGCCELLERWAAARVYFGRLTPPTIPRSYLRQFAQEAAIIEAIEQSGKYRVTVKDFSCGARIPALGLIVENRSAHRYRLNVGCDTSFQVALSRCLTEIYQGMRDEESFDRFCSPISEREPSYFVDDTLVSRHRRCLGFEAFKRDCRAAFPAALLGGEAGYAFARDVWGPRASYEEEVQRLVAFFHQAGHNVYIRDVSFLGFPSVRVYVPEISAMSTSQVPAPGSAESSLALALDAIEDKALQLKRCSDEDLAAVAEALDRLPAASRFTEVFGLELERLSPWRDVPLAFLLAQIRYRLGQHGKARESLHAFLGTRAEPYRYRYYEGVIRYLALRAEGLAHAEAARQLGQDPEWGETGRLIAEEMADPSQVFRFTKLPNCPDCEACELQPECNTGGALAIVDRLYPAMRQNRIEQRDLAWVHPSAEQEVGKK
ncbi:MAG: YcaO-like family protein [Anaerolineae bacterium]|nr:YcaO-like family protein [Anaerolineae bacterium]